MRVGAARRMAVHQARETEKGLELRLRSPFLGLPM